MSRISSCLSCRDIHHVIKREKLKASESLPANLITSNKSNLSLEISTDAMGEQDYKAPMKLAAQEAKLEGCKASGIKYL